MRLFSLILVLVACAGCGSGEQPAATPVPLEDTPWVLVSGVDVPGSQAAAPTANFAGGRLSGSLGCNRYSAEVSLDGSAFDVGGFRATKMGCGATASAADEAFAATLLRVARWSVVGEALTLLDGEDRELLHFEIASPIGDWEAIALGQSDSVSSLLGGTTITAAFRADGQLSGSAGCNRYTASFTGSRGALEIGTLAATELVCDASAAVSREERAYLDALPRAARYRVEGSTLILLSSAGTIVATFARAG